MGSNYRNEDLEFRPVSSPARYGSAARGPVQYVVVANEDGVVGYLWASDPDDSAGYEYARAAGDAAANAGVLWYKMLRSAKAEGLTPRQALARLADAGHSAIGWIVPGSERTVPSLAAVKEIAGS